jgi:hypothetical protein
LPGVNPQFSLSNFIEIPDSNIKNSQAREFEPTEVHKFVWVKRKQEMCQWHIYPLNGFARMVNPGVLSEARMAET